MIRKWMKSNGKGRVFDVYSGIIFSSFYKMVMSKALINNS